MVVVPVVQIHPDSKMSVRERMTHPRQSLKTKDFGLLVKKA